MAANTLSLREAHLLGIIQAQQAVIDHLLAQLAVSGAGAGKDELIKVMESVNWSQRDAAELLGISPRVLNYRLMQFGLRPKDRVAE